jgi:hypothetical protein
MMMGEDTVVMTEEETVAMAGGAEMTGMTTEDKETKGLFRAFPSSARSFKKGG